MRTSCTSCGCITTPSFAAPAATIAICIGVTRVSYWPMPVLASCALLRSSPIVEGVTDIGMERSWPKPNSSAVAESSSSPSSFASRAKEVLQDCSRADISVDSSLGPQASWLPPAWLFITEEVLGSV